jgi:hypothetical protein
VLAQKLKALKADLKKCNEEIFGDVGKRKREMVEGLCALDLLAEERSLTEVESIKKEEYFRDL